MNNAILSAFYSISKSIDDSDLVIKSSPVSLVLVGGAALFHYGIRSSIRDKDFYVSESLFAGRVLSELSLENIDLINESVLDRRLEFPDLNDRSCIVDSISHKNTIYELRIISPEDLLIEKLYLGRDKSYDELQELLEICSTDSLCESVSAYAMINDDDVMIDIGQSLLQELQLNWLISDSPVLENTRDFIRSIDVSDEVRRQMKISTGTLEESPLLSNYDIDPKVKF